MNDRAIDITALLNTSLLDSPSEDQLYRLLEKRFRRIASARMSTKRANHTLQPTALANDAFIKLVRGRDQSWENRQQFFAAAARVMRQLLVDYWRKATAVKRGGKERNLNLDSVPGVVDKKSGDPAEIVMVAEAVKRLETEYPDVFQTFDLHYYAGFELKEIAEQILDVSYETVKRRWATARAFLRRELAGGDESDE